MFSISHLRVWIYEQQRKTNGRLEAAESEAQTMINCDMCGKYILETEFAEVIVNRKRNFIACDDCSMTWHKTEMMYYDVLEEEE